MKKGFLLVPTGMLFTVLGCSGGPQRTVLSSAPAVVQASGSPTSAVIEPATALPVPSVGKANQQGWRSENVRDYLGSAIAIKETSLDGKFDLIIVRRGKDTFLSFARQGRWKSVHQEPGKGRLMSLRVKFEDGQEKRVEWDEVGFATENVCSVLWSYPAKTDAPIGTVQEGANGDSSGGDQLLIQDMMQHKTMLLEVEPGVTAQFDMTGLAQKIEKASAAKTQPAIEARQTSE